MSITKEDDEQYQKGLKELDKYFNQKWGFPKKGRNKNKNAIYRRVKNTNNVGIWVERTNYVEING
jgi:hypothetical protein